MTKVHVIEFLSLTDFSHVLQLEANEIFTVIKSQAVCVYEFSVLEFKLFHIILNYADAISLIQKSVKNLIK